MVILGQEHHVRVEGIDGVGRSARALGWLTLCAAAAVGTIVSSSSGGVVIMARAALGVSATLLESGPGTGATSQP